MMKKLLISLLFLPLLMHSNDKDIPTKIKEVTVYLSGAQITRTAQLQLNSGTTEYVFSGLSHKIDESSIQISGLQAVSILSMSYDINYLAQKINTPHFLELQQQINTKESRIARLKNRISGLKEEEEVIYTNRAISNRLQSFDLEKIKRVSSYYRERITAIKDETFSINQEVNKLGDDIRSIKKQMAELNNAPEKEQGEIKIKFDAPMASKLNLLISYQVEDAGWIPNYDIKSNDINAPLSVGYKAHVYQKTGNDWDNVTITLSTGNPNVNVGKPHLGPKYLNFTKGYSTRTKQVTKKQRYVYNPSVRKITGMVLDQSGAPLPGVNVLVKGTTNGTQTDFDGYFSLDVQNGRELVVSYLGFNSKELPIYSSSMNINLEEDAQVLEEVVVLGYGSSRKSQALSSSVSHVNVEDLQGNAAGITRTKSYSRTPPPQPPIYVIDGVIAKDFVEGDLDDDEIQSIEVLKGAGATELYGSRGANGIIVITTTKSTTQEKMTNTDFIIKKPYTIPSDGDVTAIEINTFTFEAKYEHFAAPIINENVFLTTTFENWEQYNLLPGEANVYFEGAFTGKTTLDPYITKKEMTLSLGIDPNITVIRKQNKNFKSKSFTGNSRVLDRTYELTVKNNKATPIVLKLMDRIPLTQNKDIKVDDIEAPNATHDPKKGLLTWKLHLDSQESKTESFSFQVKYPKYKSISL